MVECVVEGVTYEIPEMWLAGASQGGRSYYDAVLHWVEQDRLARLFAAQKGVQHG